MCENRIYVVLGPKVFCLGPKVNLLFWNHDFLSKGHVSNKLRATPKEFPLLKRLLFSLHNFARPWLEQGFRLDALSFFGPKNSDFGPKILFFAIGPQILSIAHL